MFSIKLNYLLLVILGPGFFIEKLYVLGYKIVKVYLNRFFYTSFAIKMSILHVLNSLINIEHSNIYL